jgi:hypothetical protein
MPLKSGRQRIESTTILLTRPAVVSVLWNSKVQCDCPQRFREEVVVVSSKCQGLYQMRNPNHVRRPCILYNGQKTRFVLATTGPLLYCPRSSANDLSTTN